MKRLSLCMLGTILLIFGASAAGAFSIDLTGGKGVSVDYHGATFVEFDDIMQSTVSAGTGVIDPFLTVKANTLEEGFSTDAYPVLDAHRNVWNHSIQISDLVVNSDYPDKYEFLVDINEPGGDKSLLTQHELQVYLVPNAAGGSIATFSDLQAAGTKIWDLDEGPEGDITIEYDYDIWNGSGQNIDAGTYIPTSLFSGWSPDDYVYLYVQFGQLDNPGGFPSQDGFEEYILREGVSVPEPTTILLLGSGLLGLAAIRRKSRKS